MSPLNPLVVDCNISRYFTQYFEFRCVDFNSGEWPR